MLTLLLNQHSEFYLGLGWCWHSNNASFWLQYSIPLLALLSWKAHIVILNGGVLISFCKWVHYGFTFRRTSWGCLSSVWSRLLLGRRSWRWAPCRTIGLDWIKTFSSFNFPRFEVEFPGKILCACELLVIRKKILHQVQFAVILMHTCYQCGILLERGQWRWSTVRVRLPLWGSVRAEAASPSPTAPRWAPVWRLEVSGRDPKAYLASPSPITSTGSSSWQIRPCLTMEAL